MNDFITEESFETFEGWLRNQGGDAAELPPDQLEMYRTIFEEGRAIFLATPNIGRIKFKPTPNEYRYAVAIRKGRKGDDLWLTLWAKRSSRGEFFVMVPRADGHWNPHMSYHLDGKFHSKSYGRIGITKQYQPLTGKFTGTEHLGVHGGHTTKIGAVCDPADFHGVVEVPPGVLGPWNDSVLVDLIEPGCTPLSHPGRITQEQVFEDFLPHLVVRIAAS